MRSTPVFRTVPSCSTAFPTRCCSSCWTIHPPVMTAAPTPTSATIAITDLRFTSPRSIPA